MKLPPAIQIYFDADQVLGAPAPVYAFSPDAIVKDEGKTHVGHKAIETWWRAAKAQYQHTATPLNIADADDRITVTAEVSGQFPGSPAPLSFTFKLKGDRIASLEIGA